LIKEVLIKSGRAELRFKNSSFKAQIAGNSIAIAEICNAEGVASGLKAAGHGFNQRFLKQSPSCS
jgi:hypothetical protein